MAYSITGQREAEALVLSTDLLNSMARLTMLPTAKAFFCSDKKGSKPVPVKTEIGPEKGHGTDGNNELKGIDIRNKNGVSTPGTTDERHQQVRDGICRLQVRDIGYVIWDSQADKQLAKLLLQQG
jgi:hypothetical protein